MMNRMRRTRKSPSPSTSDESVPGSSNVRPVNFSLFGAGSSPILSHRTSVSGAAGLGATYAFTGFKPAQKSLLQSVMRNLMDSEDDQERSTQRIKLENDLAVTSERLDHLVQEHRAKLHGTLSTFDAVDKKIKDSQDKIQQVKTSLKSCKSLLRCKREELKRLWLEDVKYKHMLQMIENVEEVRSVPEKVAKLKAGKRYLEATEVLQNSVASLDKKLSTVEALKDLREELKQQKESLHEELIDELHRHLYVKAAAIHRPKQHLRGLSDVPAPTPSKRVTTLTRTTQAFSKAQAEASVASTEKEEPSSSVSDVDPEKDSSRYMAVLVESLSMLGRVQDALDAIQQRMEKEFLLIIEKASIQVTRTREREEGHVGRKGRGFVQENLPKQLTKMLQICFDRFRGVVAAHTILLKHFEKTKKTYKAPYTLYTISDVWVAIQQVVENALQVYLAYDEEGLPNDGVSGYAAFTSPGDASSVFSRRKNPTSRVTKKPLFKFDSSRHAISISSYMREQRDLELADGDGGKPVAAHHYEHDQPSISQHLVCRPHNRNITVIFKVMKDFIEEVEEALDLEEDQHCQLYNFLHGYVERDFLERIHTEFFEKMGNCAKPEAAKTIAPDQKSIKVTGAKLSVLNSVLTVWQLVVELRQLMKDLPLYSGHFLSILCELLIGYRESLQLLFKGLVTVAVETVPSGRGGTLGGTSVMHEGVVSSKWAKDEQVTKALKSMSTWIKVRQRLRAKGAEEDRIQTVYSKESELLTSLVSEQLRKHNVILSHDSLRLLAILHESLDWFSGRLKQVVFELSGRQADVTDGGAVSTPVSRDSPEITEDLELVEQFSSIQLDFQGLAEMTIIMLHLEVRCHCFYFLLPAVQKGNYICNADGSEDEAVQQLAKDLKNIDLVMVAVLSQEKYRYLFEGVGHIVAAIFISSTNYIKAINTNGVKRMCRNILVLQSCLSKITLIRERELDKARKYFEMLYLTFDEIIENVLEHGPMYAEEDYQRALQLLANSGGTPKGESQEETDKKLEGQLQQLHNIFSGDTV